MPAAYLYDKPFSYKEYKAKQPTIPAEFEGHHGAGHHNGHGEEPHGNGHGHG